MPEKFKVNILSEDTIAAIATAPGMGAIGIVRMSGNRAIEVAQACFDVGTSDREIFPDHQLVYGKWIHPQSGKILDEVMVVAMRSPQSYTREDMVEVYGHGGPLVLQKILEAAIASGARSAMPGEFTLRAFRSGRIDLLQAESVSDLIEAQTDTARRMALRSLRGGWSKRVSGMKEEVMEILSHLETHLEFPLEDLEPLPPEELRLRIGKLKKEIEELLVMSDRSDLYRRGLFTVITGRPNVGKSLLFNRVLGRNRALVTDQPGTTRDTLEERVSISGLEMLLIDTAGGRKGGEEVERLGMERTTEAVSHADLIWFLVDVSEGIGVEDEIWLGKILSSVDPEKTPFFLVLNKVDLIDQVYEIENENFCKIFPEENRFFLSAKTGKGVESFLSKVLNTYSTEKSIEMESDLLVNQRHRETLEEIHENLDRVEQFYATPSHSLDCMAIDLWSVKNGLDLLDGTKSSDDLLGEIFSSILHR